MAESLWGQFQKFRDQNQAEVKKANAPNLLGVRPSEKEIYQNAPLENLKSLGNTIAAGGQAMVDRQREVRARAMGENPQLLPTPEMDAARRLTPASPLVPPASTSAPAPDSLSGSLGAAAYPNDNSISNLGNRAAAQDLAARGQGALLANQGYQPISDQGMSGIMRQVTPAPGFGPENPNRVPGLGQSAGTTIYQVPGVQGQATFQGVPAQQRGTLSAPDQGNGGTVEGNVAAMNRQIEALRSLREAQNPGITTRQGSAQVASPDAPDLWARPGDSWGDSGKRQQEYQGLLREAGNESGWGASKRAAAKIATAQGLAAPGLEAAKLQQEQQVSANTRDAQNAQARASLYGHQIDAQNKDREFGLQQQNYELNKSKAGMEQQTAQVQQALLGVNAQKGASDLERETALNDILAKLQQTDPKSPEYKKLSDLYMLGKRGMEPKADPYASLVAPQ